MGPKPINITQARTYLELMSEKKKKLMLSRRSNSCMATVSKSIRRKPCLELMIPMWLQIQVYVDHWVRSTYGWGCRTNEECKVQIKEVKFRDVKVIAHVHHIAVNHWRQMGGAKAACPGLALSDVAAKSLKLHAGELVGQKWYLLCWKSYAASVSSSGRTAQRRPHIVTY